MRNLLLIFCILFCSCTYDDFPEWSNSETSNIIPNAFIETINSLSTDYPQQIMTNHTLKATVTSSDETGNFYKSIFVDDGTAALEIMVGLYDMYNLYPVGTELIIECEGLYIMTSEGVTGLGEEGGTSLGYFSHKYLAQKYLTVNSYNNTVTPITLSINDLTTDYCGRLIKLSDVYYSSEDYTTWASYNSWTGYYGDSYREFSDKNGNIVNVLTSGYADFAGDEIPTGEIDLCGILFYSSSKGFYLKIRGLEDITEH